MATVVHALWASGDQAPLILPASVPLDHPAVLEELTRNLDDAWKPIIDADVDGPSSLPRALDDEVRGLGRYAAARRVARAVFLGSAPLAGSPNRGIDAARVRLACALPRDTLAVYADALSRLTDRGTYFFAGGGRYWYATQASIGRVARDRAERLLAGDRAVLHDHLIERLTRAHHGHDFSAVQGARSRPGTVFSHPSKIEMVREAAHRGHLVTLRVLLVPENLAVARVANRAENGGHDVPEEKIRQRCRRLWPHIVEAIALAHETCVYDNTVAEDGMQLVARFERGRLAGDADWPAWAPVELRSLRPGHDDCGAGCGDGRRSRLPRRTLWS